MLSLIKWTGTGAVILSSIFRIIGLHYADLFIGVIGTVLWSCAAYKEKDYPLLTVNVFLTGVLLLGMLL